jgi:hypothetical protein
MYVNLDDFAVISDVDVNEFSSRGCENADCPERGKGGKVHECVGKKSVHDSNEDAYEFDLCEQCFYEWHYGPQ